MRVGLMIGSDRDRERGDRLAGIVEDARNAEDQGYTSYWVPQIPGYFDAMTAIALAGEATSRIELGTAVMPVQTRHPVAMAQQALTTQAACGGRFTLGLGASHHWIVDDQLGLRYDRPAHLVRDYLEVINACMAASGRVDVQNETFEVHSPMDVIDGAASGVVIAALGPVMLRIAAELASGTILWMADERAVGDHVVPHITKSADAAGRPAPRIIACVPVALCPNEDVDAARQRASDMLGHAELSPNYLRLLEHGDADDVGDVMAAGDEAAIETRLKRFRDAGVTDLAARVVPLGKDAQSRAESRRRTQEFVSSLCPEI
jgi:F420-dependent oxidoreductase-like protein